MWNWNDWLTDWQTDERTGERTDGLSGVSNNAALICQPASQKSVREIKSILIRHSNQLDSTRLSSVQLGSVRGVRLMCAVCGKWQLIKNKAAAGSQNFIYKSVHITNAAPCIDTNRNECNGTVLPSPIPLPFHSPPIPPTAEPSSCNYYAEAF